MSGQSGKVASATTTASTQEEKREGRQNKSCANGDQARTTSAQHRHCREGGGRQHPGRASGPVTSGSMILPLSAHGLRASFCEVSAAETPHALLDAPTLTGMPKLGQSARERCLNRHRVVFGPHSSAGSAPRRGPPQVSARMQMRADAAVRRNAPLALSDRGTPWPLHRAHSTAPPLG